MPTRTGKKGAAMHYTEAKTILSGSFGMNLYRGCSHGNMPYPMQNIKRQAEV